MNFPKGNNQVIACGDVILLNKITGRVRTLPYYFAQLTDHL